MRCKKIRLVDKRLTHILARYGEFYSLEELLELDELDDVEVLDEVDEVDEVNVVESLDTDSVGEVIGSGLSGGLSF